MNKNSARPNSRPFGLFHHSSSDSDDHAHPAVTAALWAHLQTCSITKWAFGFGRRKHFIKRLACKLNMSKIWRLSAEWKKQHSLSCSNMKQFWLLARNIVFFFNFHTKFYHTSKFPIWVDLATPAINDRIRMPCMKLGQETRTRELIGCQKTPYAPRKS